MANLDEINLTFVSLYTLTDSMLSAIYIYAHNPDLFTGEYRKPKNDAPMVFANYKYDVGYWPKEYVEKVSNLVQFNGELYLLAVEIGCCS